MTYAAIFELGAYGAGEKARFGGGGGALCNLAF
jgi:hypothetical protein